MPTFTKIPNIREFYGTNTFKSVDGVPNTPEQIVGLVPMREEVDATKYLLLSLTDAPEFAYSLRRLGSEDKSIRVRRSSDNAEQDIGFIGLDLDTASLLSFVGAGDGFVSIIYSQDGLSRDMSQPTASKQGKIVSSGSLVTNPLGKVSIESDGVDDLYQSAIIPTLTAPYHQLLVLDRIGSQSGRPLGGTTSSGSNCGNFFYLGGGQLIVTYRQGSVFSDSVDTTGLDNNIMFSEAGLTDTDWRLNINNNEATNAGESIGTALGREYTLFGRGNDTAHNSSYWNESVVWNGRIPSNFNEIYSNISSYWL